MPSYLAINGEPHSKGIDAWAHIDLGEIFDVTGQRDRAVNEYRRAIGTGVDSEGAQAVAARLLTEGIKGNNFTVHRVLGGQFSLAELAKPLVSVPAEYSKEARIAEPEGSVTFVAILAADGSMPASTLIDLDFLLPEKQSHWHLVRVVFDAPEGTERPHFEKANYPAGDGISPASFDDARLLAVLGRQAVVTPSSTSTKQAVLCVFKLKDPLSACGATKPPPS